MSNTKTSVALLRGLITEMITVAVEHPDSAELKLYELGDDDGDELEWYLDKYGRPSWESTEKFLARGEKFTKARRKGEEPSLSKLDPFYGMDLEKRASTIKSINDMINSLVPANQAQQLKDTILPWKGVGFDALRRIYIAEKRTKKDFPFFASAGNVAPGNVIAFPSDPTEAVIAFLADQKTRVGTNDTGKGELLLALMTGGVPPGPDGVGDIVIDGKAWEVKDLRTSKSARVGDAHSTKFLEEVEKWLAAKRPSVDPKDYINSFKSKAAWPTEDFPYLNGILHRVLAEGLSGIVVVEDKKFVVVPITHASFSGTNKQGRVHFNVASSPVKTIVDDDKKKDEADAEAAEAGLD